LTSVVEAAEQSKGITSRKRELILLSDKEVRAMGTRSKKKSTKISFKGESKWDAIYVPCDTAPRIIAALKMVVPERAGYLYRGKCYKDIVDKTIDGLDEFFKEKLRAKNLIEGKPIVWTLSDLIELDHSLRKHNKNFESTRPPRCHRYLLELFFFFLPLDSFVEADAVLFRAYLNSQRTARKIEKESANEFIKELKTVFKQAVKRGWLAKNPFEFVKIGNTVNTDRRHLVTEEEVQAAVKACCHPEQHFYLAIGHYAGLRWSDMKDLKISDFTFYSNGSGIFRVPKSGKTNTRTVPFPPPLRPYYDAVLSAASDGQGLLFVKYRKYANLIAAIRRDMKRAGLTLWAKPNTNLRSSCQTKLDWANVPTGIMDAIFGNSEKVRKSRYLQDRPDESWAELGALMSEAVQSNGAAHPKIPPGMPPFPPESDDPEEFQKWTESVIEQGICRPFGLKMSAKELMDEWNSSYEFTKGVEELNSMLEMVCDFSNGKISVEDAEKRIDDSSYRAMFFRDEYVKKGLQLSQESGGQTAPTDRLGRT
jgi:integrase